jgi:hypothetical protein
MMATKRKAAAKTAAGATSADKEAAKAPRTAAAKEETEAQRAAREAEEGTGNAPEKGYSGTRNYTAEPSNFNTDPGQVSDEELRRDREAQRLSNT